VTGGKVRPDRWSTPRRALPIPALGLASPALNLTIAVMLAATPAVGQATRTVAFTYDDLPANILRGDVSTMREVTDGLLAGLRRHRIPAIGFVNESKLFDGGTLDEARVALLREWLDEGHELGNHSFSHPDINTTPLDEYQADVLRGERVTRPLLAEEGLELRYFRHPMLHTGLDLETKSTFERFLEEHEYRIAPVTIDNQEWIFARAYDHAHVRGDADLKRRIATEYVAYMDSIFGYYEQQSRALLGYELPQVLLVHANRLNADAMDPLVGAIRARGYDFVTLDEALEDEAYRLPDEYVGRAGITWLHRWALAQGKRGEFFAGEPDVPAFVREVYEDPPDR
jgi:peptidoglycan/xylan/chitin deacetylase (PgdA/CDA1 family)